MKRIIITIIFFATIILNANAKSTSPYNSKADSNRVLNQLEIDLQMGISMSNTNFHYPQYVNKIYTTKFMDEGTTGFIGLSVPLSNSWHLRTEIGLMSTRSYFSIEYDDDDLVDQRNKLSMRINNVKIYLAFLPEYRIKFKKSNTYFKIFAGPMLNANVVNTEMSFDGNKQLGGDYIPLGFKTGLGIIYMFKTMGLTFNYSYVRLARTELIGYGEPTMSHNQIHMNCGVVYTIQ